ncbi:MAG TPA: putative hydroxymethylpyrimidine transporter CytX [Actinomycetota bacterium]|nr:putative hydroxymethylpyrimidine transporter CytX [Actinomycetota bacterium]
MATVLDRIERALEREAPAWGIEPVPVEHRRLSGLDVGVLWASLALGFLVLVTGTLLVPALGLPEALLAIVVGSAIGCAPLALVAVAGQREGVPGMVLFRPLLGVGGSYLPTALNVLQLVGWTGVEFWAMGTMANRMSLRLFGLDAYPLWLLLAAVICTALALGGPVLVVRRWLERFGIYLVVAAAAWITAGALARADLGALWRRPGEGGLPFWLAVDLVIAMPISWLPLVADYSRFARRDARVLAGTYWGYLLGNVWFYALGALLVLSAGAEPSVGGIALAVAGLTAGPLVLVALLAVETDEAFADVYSAAVSAQNVAPRADQRRLVLSVAALGLALAWFLSMDAYEVFLFLIGSVFVPLFGVFAAHYFVLHRGRYGPRAVGDGGPRLRPAALLPWAVGFVLYHWSVPTGPPGWQAFLGAVFRERLGLPFPLLGSALGASVPSVLAAFLLAIVVLGPASRRRPGARGVARPR